MRRCWEKSLLSWAQPLGLKDLSLSGWISFHSPISCLLWSVEQVYDVGLNGSNRNQDLSFKSVLALCQDSQVFLPISL